MERFAFPAIYDTAFQFRRPQRVVDFIEQSVEAYGEIPVRSVLDVACGTGHYTREFARRQYHTYGVDINPASCQYARERAEADALTLHVVCDDMVNFQLPFRCDLAVNFFDSLTYLCRPHAIVEHFKAVSQALFPGGLYIIELGVIDLFSNHNVEEVWTETRRDLSVTTSYFRSGWIDPESQTFLEDCTFRATCRDHAAFFHAKSPKLALEFDEFQQLVQQSGRFEALACYEDFKPDASLQADELPWRVIAMLLHTGDHGGNSQKSDCK